jgi:hypothetical protein
MKNFQKHYDKLVREQEFVRIQMLAKWELYEHKDEIMEQLREADPGYASLYIGSMFYLSWFITKVSVEDALKTLVNIFPDLGIKRKEAASIICSATFVGYNVHIDINMSRSTHCKKVHVDDRVEPVYEYVCS